MRLVSTYFIGLFFLVGLACAPELPAGTQTTTATNIPPNILIIFADDQGYGDLSCYGSPKIKTPNIDQLAREGLRLTNFYAFPSCSPSRAALLTGCYPPRVGFPDVVGPPGPDWTKDKQYGLNPSETTLPEVLQPAGYTSALIGKWHLGHFPESMPLQHGFDYFYGLPYSNDMIPSDFQTYPNLALLRGEDTLAINPDQRELTENYTQEAIGFIEQNQSQPFLLYLAHSMPHVPLFTSPEFDGHSGQGKYTDVIEEIDASVGRIVKQLEKLGLRENTLIIYTSDNGPWLTYGDHAGSAGPFREGKGTTYEGGMRVPFIASWPAKIGQNQISHAPASLIDLLPTLAKLAGGKLPANKIDGRNLSGLLTSGEVQETTPFFYYRSGQVEAVRLGDWKLHRPHSYRYVDKIGFGGVRGNYAYQETDLELYNLQEDPSERYNRAEDAPQRVAELMALMEAEQAVMDKEKREPFRPVE